MPPKKKQKVARKPGKILQYLTNDFSLFPDDLNNLKNGHILFIYTTNDSSVTKTINAVNKKNAMPDFSSPADHTFE